MEPDTSSIAVTATPKIYAEMVALRKAIGGLQAKKVANGPSFAIKSAKDLGIKLRDGLDALGMNCYVVDHQITNIDTDKGTGCLVRVVVELVASDGSAVRFTGVGHGIDRDDKAAGKASTYAWKDAITKGLNLPDAEMKDTDDEEGVGKEVKPKVKAANSDLEAVLASLAAVSSKAALEGVLARARELKFEPAEKQRILAAKGEAIARLGG